MIPVLIAEALAVFREISLIAETTEVVSVAARSVASSKAMRAAVKNTVVELEPVFYRFAAKSLHRKAGEFILGSTEDDSVDDVLHDVMQDIHFSEGATDPLGRISSFCETYATHVKTKQPTIASGMSGLTTRLLSGGEKMELIHDALKDEAFVNGFVASLPPDKRDKFKFYVDVILEGGVPEYFTRTLNRVSQGGVQAASLWSKMIDSADTTYIGTSNLYNFSAKGKILFNWMLSSVRLPRTQPIRRERYQQRSLTQLEVRNMDTHIANINGIKRLELTDDRFKDRSSKP